MLIKPAILVASVLSAALFAAPPAMADTTYYGPYYGPNGGRAGAVVWQNPVNGNRHVAWGAQGPNGHWVSGHGGVYHGPCGTAWRGVHRGPNGVVVRHGAVGNGAC